LIVGNQCIDDVTCSVHPLARIGSQQHWPPLEGDFAHIFERQIISIDV
jgi:hypothetical protein